MSKPEFPRPLRGVIPPLITPLAERDRLDVPGLERLVEHVLAGGVHGLFVLGTTGEGPSLSLGLRHELIERVCKQVASRVPVLVGISDASLVESLRLSEHAEDAGAAALVAAAPYYFPIGPAELRQYVLDLAREAPLPLFLYNMPSHTKVAIDLDTVRAALELPQIVGLKDSGGNMSYFHQVQLLLPQRPDWSLLIGPEELLAEAVLMGGHGGVTGGANLAPRLYVDIYEAAARGEIARARELQARVWALSRALYGFGVHRSLKFALSVLGVCNALPAEPFYPLNDQEKRTIRERLTTLGFATLEGQYSGR